MAKTNERIEGIFDKWDVPDEYAKISETSANGTIKGEVKIKTKDVHSTALHTSNTKKHIGLEITVKNQRGKGVVYIPQKQIPPISELVAMENSGVKYESRIWSSPMEGTFVDSKLRFLEGELAGKTYEGREFA